MGVTGDLFNAIGSIPSPASVPLLALGTGLTTFAEKFRDTAKDEATGYIGQAEAKSQQVAKLIQEKKEAGTFLEMRPNLSDPTDYFWEYRSGNKWLPVMDNGTGKKMSMMRGQDKIVPFSDGSGIQRYRIKTNTGIRDLEIDPSGKIVMRIPNIPNGVPVTSKESSSSARPVTPQAKPAVGAKLQSITDPTIQNDLNAVDRDVSTFDRLFGKISSIFETKELTRISSSSFAGTTGATETISTGTPGTVESSKAGDFTATRGNLTITRTEVQKQALANATFNNEMFLGQTNPRITSPFYKWRSADWYVARFGKGKNHSKPHAHGGVDIGVPSGTKVRSLYSGRATVSELGLSVDTDRDIRLNYWHIQPSVKTGDSVVVGQELGTVYKDKYSTGPHLHFEVQSLEGMRQDKKVSPSAYVIDPAAWLADKDAPAHKFDLLPYTSQTAAFVKGSDSPRKIPAYAKGTSYVPEDMVARVHKDEIILTQQQAKKIKAEAKSRKPNISKIAELQEYNVFEDSDFWINTFMPALAEVVRMEYET
jgi:murein DD-endopeptidase MepM/ murein hydrolase activator NlpD